MKKAALAFESGEFFLGLSFGWDGENHGEAVFNTSMSGYQEILTDPSYKSQIITLTYPEIGNYGISDEANESSSIHASGLVVKNYNAFHSNFTASQSLGDFLLHHQIPAIWGVDTRKITRIIRIGGAKKAIISTQDLSRDSLVKKAIASPSIEHVDLIKEVSTSSSYSFDEMGLHEDAPLIAVFDFGVKRNILKSLNQRGYQLKVFPARTLAKEILKHKPVGIFLSNGPGDPSAVPDIVDNIKSLKGVKPMFGICFGHQIIAQTYGLKTFKLKFGHRGGNQPVKRRENGQIEITSQNHGFAVIKRKIKGVKISHLNCNDDTIEGIEDAGHKIFSVQYHPEACPGPRDSNYLFDKFDHWIKK